MDNPQMIRFEFEVTAEEGEAIFDSIQYTIVSLNERIMDCIDEPKKVQALRDQIEYYKRLKAKMLNKAV